jgi:hypothetical protein
MQAIRFVGLALCVIFAAGAFQLTLAAAGVIDVGEAPGAEPAGAALAGIAFVCLLAAAPLAAVSAASSRAASALRRAWPLPIVGAWLAVAHALSPDVYYAPHVRRFASSSGQVWSWLLATIIVGGVGSLVLARRPRIGLLVCAVALALDVATMLIGAFH